MVETEHQNIAPLILPGGAPIWFDVKKAEGPIRTTPFERQDGVRSAMMLAGRQQYLSSSPPPKSARQLVGRAVRRSHCQMKDLLPGFAAMVALLPSFIIPRRNEMWDK
jgi:hypothetical protein